MPRKIIPLLLFLFFTQTVLAGIDVHAHQGNDNNSEFSLDEFSLDIVQHYIDSHSALCSFEHNSSTADMDDSQHQQSSHHHDCHGHTPSFTFTHNSFSDFIFSSFSTPFNYQLSDYSITLDLAYRPPITI